MRLFQGYAEQLVLMWEVDGRPGFFDVVRAGHVLFIQKCAADVGVDSERLEESS